jgi:hypothetical protein
MIAVSGKLRELTMSATLEVLYKSPADLRRENVISRRVEKYGGRLTYREEPDASAPGPVCLTFEFNDLGIGQEAATSLRSQGEHVEGPSDYGD